MKEGRVDSVAANYDDLVDNVARTLQSYFMDARYPGHGIQHLKLIAKPITKQLCSQ